MLRKVRLIVKRLSRVLGLRMPIVRLWNTYEHLLLAYSIRRNSSGTDRVAVIEPLSIFWIPPTEVEVISGGSFDFIRDTGRVVGGTWDLGGTIRPTEWDCYRWFERRFEEGFEWAETEQYARSMERIREGHSSRYASVEAFERKLRSYDLMYEAFERGNYRLQSELVDDRVVGEPGSGGRALFPSWTDSSLMRHEIAVDIGRDGTLFRNEGRHRLALALLADLYEIPVRVVVRHAEWQALRDEIACSIDAALEAGVGPEDVRAHVEGTFSDELDDVPLGVTHPDLEVIFERRLPESGRA